ICRTMGYRTRPAAAIQAGSGNETQGRHPMTSQGRPWRGRRIGDIAVARAVEIVSPFDPTMIFHETTPAHWTTIESWLKPRAMDPQTGALLFPVQSYLLRTAQHTILIDSCVGNHKERPNRPFWHQKTDDTYLRQLAALEVAPEAIDYVL